jgi:hypothetical protein
MQPFARTIHEIPKYVASTTLESVDWDAELLGGDLREAVHGLKSRPGGPLRLGGSAFATYVVGWGLVDEYGFTVYPWGAGHGPYLLAGLPHPDRPPRPRLRSRRDDVPGTRLRLAVVTSEEAANTRRHGSSR